MSGGGFSYILIMTHFRKLQYIVNHFEKNPLLDVKILKGGDDHYAIKKFWYSDSILRLLGIKSLNGQVGNLAVHYALYVSNIYSGQIYILGMGSYDSKIKISIIKRGEFNDLCDEYAVYVLNEIYSLLRKSKDL